MTLTKAEVIGRLEARVKAAGSQVAAAKELGVSQQYLNDVMRGRLDPGAKILDPINVERVVVYREKADA